MPTATTSPPPPSAPEPPSQPPPLASHSPPLPSPTPPQIRTYHHICLTHILTTPYALPTLPTRTAPSLDHARILPLPPLSPPSPSPSPSPLPSLPPESKSENSEQQTEKYLPSLLHNLRPARKALVIQREDGWERRRVWRCGRCGVGVGYEIEGTDAVDGGGGKDKGEREGERLRVMYLLDEGLVETEEMMAAGGG